MAEKFRLLQPRLWLACGAVLLAGRPGVCATIHANSGIDQPMDRQPQLPHPKTVETFNPAYRALWRQALAWPSVQVRCHVCQALQQAGQAGFPGLAALRHSLEHLAAASHEKAILRESAVQALAAINQKASAAAIFQAEKLGGVDVTLSADAVLASWRYRPAMAWWLSRLLNDRVETPVKVSAITALAKVEDAAAIGPLRQLASSAGTDIRTRLAAAQALAHLHAGDLAGMAQKLLALGPRAGPPAALHEELIAAFLVSGGRTAAQRKILAVLARSPNLAVRVIAVRALLRAHWRDLLPDTAALTAAGSSTLRVLAARLARRAKNVPVLKDLLNDARRPVRWYARDALVLLGRQPKLSATIEHGLVQLLAPGHPRQQRQAALALGMLDYRPAAPHLLTLLSETAHPGVRLGALVALRRLAMPATLPPLLIYARRDAAASRHLANSKMQTAPAVAVFQSCGQELGQLLQLFGKTRYRPASHLLEKFIPKHSPYAIPARAAAIWALGKIHAGDKNSPLVGLFQGRLSDQSLMDPEAPAVRRMSAISLARFGSTASVPLLQGFFGEEPTSHVGLACRWAIGKLTGKTPPMPVNTIDFRNGFLAPDNPVSP